jgi:polysaccharide export outer membrane protein
MKPYLLVLACLCLAVPARAAVAPQATAQMDSVAMDWSLVPEYRIVPGDRLVLDLGPRPDGSSNYTHDQVVRPDGRITVYPVGDVVAAGLTPMDLQKNVTELLSADFRSPRVTVELVSTAASVVHVLGRVDRPGPVAAGPFITVSQAIAGAGGFKDDAARNSVVVIHRNGANSVRVVRLQMDRILKGESFSDIPLSRFDIVYVPRSSIGNLSIFLNQLFVPMDAAMDAVLKGWELFHLDRVYVTRITRD